MSNIAKKSDWKTKSMPKAHRVIAIDIGFSPDEYEMLQKGIIPQQMEDKWFIYFEDNKLYCHRSWTGFCIYIAEFSDNKIGGSVENITINRDQEQYSENDNSFDCKLLLYIIDRLLLKKKAEYPIKEDLDSDEQAISQWSNVGRAMLEEEE